MKIIVVVFEDSVDTGQVVKGASATVTQDSNTVSGTVLAVADIYEPPTELAVHTHNTTGITGLPVPE